MAIIYKSNQDQGEKLGLVYTETKAEKRKCFNLEGDRKDVCNYERASSTLF